MERPETLTIRRDLVVRHPEAVDVGVEVIAGIACGIDILKADTPSPEVHCWRFALLRRSCLSRKMLFVREHRLCECKRKRASARGKQLLNHRSCVPIQFKWRDHAIPVRTA